MLSKEKPKIYDKLHKQFGVEWDKGIIIAVYPNIHCKFDVPEQKIAHESVHLVRQQDIGVQNWWELYLTSPKFRLDEELLAYTAEIEKIRSMDINRDMRRFLFKEILDSLSGKTYGHLITREEAKTLLFD